MRRLIGAVLAVAGIWAGYWFAGSTLLERSLRDALAGAAPGITVASVEVAGFPSRFDATFTDLRTAGDLAWSAPFLQTFALSYKPWHLIAAFPPAQSLTLPDGRSLDITADRLQASLIVTPDTTLALDRTALVGSAMALRSGGTGVTLADLRLATRRDPARSHSHEIGLQVTGLRPDPGLLAPTPGQPLPEGHATLHLDAFLGFSAALDRFAGETRPVPVLVELRSARAVWGDVVAEASGRLAPDAQGFAEGQIDLSLTGAGTVIAALVAAGALRPELAQSWTQMAASMAQASTGADRIDLTLTMAGGRMRLGPLPLGPAPRLAP
jgi:hypothetical protein